MAERLTEAQELSRMARGDDGVPWGRFRALIDSLTEEQRECIRAKCQWEHVSWLGVLADWPDLFEVRATPEDTTEAPGG